MKGRERMRGWERGKEREGESGVVGRAVDGIASNSIPSMGSETSPVATPAAIDRVNRRQTTGQDR